MEWVSKLLNLRSIILIVRGGIHNEPGVRREAIPTLPVTVGNLLALLNLEMRLPKHRKVAVMVNNLGGLSVLELNVVAEEVVRQLGTTGLDVRRALVGTFVTSLDGPGFSVTILGLEDQMEELLNAPVRVAAWPNLISYSGADEAGSNDTNISEEAPVNNVREVIPGK